MPDLRIDQRTEGLHQVIDQPYGVAVVGVVQRQAGMEARGKQVPRYSGAQDGVAIVEQGRIFLHDKGSQFGFQLFVQVAVATHHAGTHR